VPAERRRGCRHLPPARYRPRPWRRTSLVLGFLFAGAISLVEIGGFSIPIALGLVGVPLSLVWYGTLFRGSGQIIAGADFARQSISRLANLRGEMMVFVGANIMGAGIASVIDSQVIANLIAAADLGVDAKIFILAMSFVILGALAIHPVILIVLLAQLLPADAMGVPPLVMVVMLMALWGISTNVSPVSATVLFVSRAANENNLTVAWRWNGPFSFSAAIVVALIVIAGRHLGFY